MRRVLALVLLALCLFAVPAQAQVVSPCSPVVAVNMGIATTVISTAPANQRLVVCTLVLGASAATTITISEGTGASCGTGNLVLGTFTAAAATTAIPFGSGAPLFYTQVRGDSLCIQNSAGTLTGMVTLGSTSN